MSNEKHQTPVCIVRMYLKDDKLHRGKVTKRDRNVGQFYCVFLVRFQIYSRGIVFFEMTCKCNRHPRRVWFFRALPLEILVGWLVDAERRGRCICRRKIYIPRPRLLLPIPDSRPCQARRQKASFVSEFANAARPSKKSFLTSRKRIKMFQFDLCVSLYIII